MEQKKIYAQGMKDFTVNIDRLSQGILKGKVSTIRKQLYISVGLISVILILFYLVLQIRKRLSIQNQQITDVNKRLKRKNLELEQFN